MPTAEIEFTALEGEKAHEVRISLMRESSSENCTGGKSDVVAFANVGRLSLLRGASRDLSGVQIPADKEIEIRLGVHYASFPSAQIETFDVAFTPAADRRYRLELEWDLDYINVRVLELAADGGIHKLPIRLEECRPGFFTIKSVPIEPG